MQTEFYARGYDYLNEDTAGRTRAKRWLNESYLELCERADWPFLEADISGVSPLTITDLRQVLSVYDNTQQIVIPGEDRRTLRDRHNDLTITGTATRWYLEGTIMKLYPVDSAASLRVRYVAIPAALSVDGDKPVIPNAYQHLIVDGAVLRGMKDSDNYADIASLRQSYEADVGRMMANYLDQNLHGPGFIVSTTGPEW